MASGKETSRKGPDRKRLTSKPLEHEDEFTLLKSVIHSLPHPFYVIDASDYSILMANPAACPDLDCSHLKCHRLTHGKDQPCGGAEHTCPLEEVKRTGKPSICEHIHYNPEGVPRFYEVHGYPILDSEGNVTRMIEFSLDITERKELEARLETLTVTDPLTELLNRRGFVAMAEKQLALANRMATPLFLLFADLDDMKAINDNHGHDQGDRALKEAADILRKTFRKGDLIGRLGGDEFAVLMNAASGNQGGPEAVERLSANVSERNRAGDLPYSLSLSTGYASFSPAEPGQTLDTLMKKADESMYAEKQRKKEQRDNTTESKGSA